MLAGNAKRIFCDNVTVICMAPRVPTAGLCPGILFRMVTRSLGCFCRALGCCVRRLTTLAISAFIFPCPKILYARDSFRHFPLATHCTACTQKSLKLQPSSSSSAKGQTGKHEEHARKHEDLLALWVAFNAEAMHQPTSCTLSMFESLSMAWPVLLKNLVGRESSDQWQEKPLAYTCFIFCCRSTWIVKMTTTLWERCNSLIFPDSGLCNDLELLEQGTPSQMQWYSVPFHHQNI